MKRDLAIRALKMAIALRLPPRGCIFHSDRGSQYCSHDYQKVLHEHGLKPSMSGKGNCDDNAAVLRRENSPLDCFLILLTCFKTIMAELIWRRTWETLRQAETAFGHFFGPMAVMPSLQYVNSFHNPRRRHSALGGKSPVAFERQVA
jgi:putative transposase